jgi:putative flippase GtrA
MNEKKRVIRFAIVGLSGTFVDFGFFNLFSIVFSIPVILSSILSFSIAVINNFSWNRIWTYPESKAKKLWPQFIKFALVSVMGLAIRTPIFALIENPFINFSRNIMGSNSFITPEIIGHNLALASVIILVLFWNYFINKFWTYKL